MNKLTILSVLVLIALTAQSGTASGPQGSRTDDLVDAPYTTIPTEELPTEGLAGALELEPLGRYGAICLTDAETDTLARIIKLEAGGEPLDGQQAAAEVVLNRIMSPEFPDTLDEVLYQEGQFSTAGNIKFVEPTETQYIAISAALSGPNIIPLEVVFFSQEGENSNVWGTIGSHVFCYSYCWEAS